MSFRDLMRYPLSTLRRWWDAHQRLLCVVLPWVTGICFALYAIWRFIHALSLL